MDLPISSTHLGEVAALAAAEGLAKKDLLLQFYGVTHDLKSNNFATVISAFLVRSVVFFVYFQHFVPSYTTSISVRRQTLTEYVTIQFGTMQVCGKASTRSLRVTTNDLEAITTLLP
ncbi:hypothetical protein WAI453_005296 [Rhynchosporium graminicola]